MIRIIMRRAFGLLALALCAWSASSCSKKGGVVDPGYTTPEGKPSPNARMYVWPNLPNFMFVFLDVAPFGETNFEDSLTSAFFVYNGNVGATHGLILDGTDATGYQAFRIESNGGARRFLDFDIPRTKRWLDTQWETYHFLDRVPSGTPTSYLGRGEILGAATRESPLTNTGRLSQRTVAFLDLRIRPAPGGFDFQFTEVPGAVGYWVHAYNFRQDIRSTFEQFLSSLPAPLYDSRSTDIFVGFLPAPGAIDTNGNVPPGASVLHFHPTTAPTFFARVAAVDANGQLLAMSPGSAVRVNGIAGLDKDGFIFEEGKFGLYFAGAQLVVPQRLSAPPTVETRIVSSLMSGYADATAEGPVPGLAAGFLSGLPAGAVVLEGRPAPIRATAVATEGARTLHVTMPWP